MRLAPFVTRLIIRTLLFAMVVAVFFSLAFGTGAAFSFLFGALVGILNGMLLRHWVEGVEGKSERAAKRAIRGGMAVRFLMIIAAVSIGTYYLGIDIVPFVLGLMLFQIVGMMHIYKEAETQKDR